MNRVIESGLREADAAWVAAYLARDIDAVDRILYPEFALVIVHPVAARIEREAFLRTLRDYVITDWNVPGSAWDVRGELATHLQLIEQTGAIRGTDRSGPFALTDIWLRDTDGIWRAWRRYSTPLRAGAWPG
jgi:hypothetical protein